MRRRELEGAGTMQFFRSCLRALCFLIFTAASSAVFFSTSSGAQQNVPSEACQNRSAALLKLEWQFGEVPVAEGIVVGIFMGPYVGSEGALLQVLASKEDVRPWTLVLTYPSSPDTVCLMLGGKDFVILDNAGVLSFFEIYPYFGFEPQSFNQYNLNFCGPTRLVLRNLAGKHGETVRVIGNTGSEIVLITVNSEMREFSVLFANTKGFAFLIVAGTDWDEWADTALFGHAISFTPPFFRRE